MQSPFTQSTEDGCELERLRQSLRRSEEEIVRLRGQLHRLQIENDRLRVAAGCYTQQLKNERGRRGEQLVAELIGGCRTPHSHEYDITTMNGGRVEVKTSKVCLDSSTCYSWRRCYSRWAWMKVLGEQGRKEYDVLVLVGEVNEEFRHLYRDPKARAVFFVIPFHKMRYFVQGRGPHYGIQLNTNPRTVRTTRGQMLYSYFERTEAEVARLFRLHRRRTGAPS